MLEGLTGTAALTPVFEIADSSIAHPLSASCSCVSGGDGGGNAVHYLQSTLTVRIPGVRGTVKVPVLDGEMEQSRTPR